MIDFKENKTPGLSNTAVKSLLRADPTSLYSIPDSAEKSNSFSEKSSEKISDGGKSSYAGESQVNHDLAEKRGERHSLKDKVDIEGEIEYNIGDYDLYTSTDDFYNTVLQETEVRLQEVLQIKQREWPRVR